MKGQADKKHRIQIMYDFDDMHVYQLYMEMSLNCWNIVDTTIKPYEKNQHIIEFYCKLLSGLNIDFLDVLICNYEPILEDVSIEYFKLRWSVWPVVLLYRMILLICFVGFFCILFSFNLPMLILNYKAELKLYQ